MPVENHKLDLKQTAVEQKMMPPASLTRGDLILCLKTEALNMAHEAGPGSKRAKECVFVLEFLQHMEGKLPNTTNETNLTIAERAYTERQNLGGTDGGYVEEMYELQCDLEEALDTVLKSEPVRPEMGAPS